MARAGIALKLEAAVKMGKPANSSEVTELFLTIRKGNFSASIRAFMKDGHLIVEPDEGGRVLLDYLKQRFPFTVVFESFMRFVSNFGWDRK